MLLPWGSLGHTVVRELSERWEPDALRKSYQVTRALACLLLTLALTTLVLLR